MYVGTIIIEFNVQISDNEAVSIIKWKNKALKNQKKCVDIQNDLNKIWEEDVPDGSFYKTNSNLYYYVHNGHRTYSSMTMKYVGTFSKIEQMKELLGPCYKGGHEYKHEAYLPYVYDYMMLQHKIPLTNNSDLLYQLQQSIPDIESLDPLTEDEWTRRLVFGLNRNGIECRYTVDLRNRSVCNSWFHILPPEINSDFLVFQGAPDVIIHKVGILSAHKESDHQDEETSDDDDKTSQHSGRVQVAHQMVCLKPKIHGSLLYEKIGELVGALHTSLACQAITKYLNGKSVESLTAQGLHVHRSHRVFHVRVILSKSAFLVKITLLTSGLLNERTMCSIMEYYCSHQKL